MKNFLFISSNSLCIFCFFLFLCAGYKKQRQSGKNHVCGASLSGFNALKEGCGGGVSLLTALYVAEDILGQKVNKE